MKTAGDILRALRAFFPSKDSVGIASYFGSKPSLPTQKDKPSPSSHLSLYTLQRYLRDGFPSSYTIMGVTDTNSEEPYIDDNCKIVLCKVQDSHIRVGNILAYEFGNKLILHRVIDIKSSMVKFQGDNNFNPDGWVPKSIIKYNLVAVAYGVQDEEGD